jgi:hypothetical protein
MTKVTILLLLAASNAISCPIGMTTGTYGFGNIACFSKSGALRIIDGSIDNCPQGFSKSTDRFGVNICTDNKVDVYDLSGGCPVDMTKSWTAFGYETCMIGNKTVVELADIDY